MAQRSSSAVRERPHPLVVTSDPQLLDDLVRLAAAGGSAVRVVTDALAARPDWSAAPFVLLGADAACDCLRAGLGARSAVVIVARTIGGALTWSMVEGLRAEHVAVLPAAEAWLVDRFAELVDGNPDRGRVVGVIGGRGGAGASVLATALAVTARRRGLDTLLVDADPYGGGIDLVLGWERMAGVRWPALVDARGRLSPPALVGALPGEGSLAVLSFDRSAVDGVPAAAMAAALDAGRRGRDLVIIDLPRHFDDASLLALTAADRAYLVVPADVRSFAAAKVIAEVVSAHCPGLALVVRGPIPGGVEATGIAAALDVPLVGVMLSDPGLGRALAGGDAPAASGRGPLAELCRNLLIDIRPRGHRAGAR
jgi:secretion/DNA translocation related CpaE-like protein